MFADVVLPDLGFAVGDYALAVLQVFGAALAILVGCWLLFRVNVALMRWAAGREMFGPVRSRMVRLGLRAKGW